ncbi:MAG: hypothetical protein JXR51_04340 [Bacteroidales bacterium]|nr:hypothetical protein [Bacteroidales bacterium]
MNENNTKHQEIEKELEEYKKLLWQLSDEYKVNVTAAEKKLEEEIKKREILENKKSTETVDSDFSFISLIGLPACIIDNKGNISKFNNKFKFLTELLFVDIEEVTTINKIIVYDKTQNLEKKINDYFTNENRLFQSIFKIENSFQNKLNLIFRIYNYDKDNHLALFIELSKSEIESIESANKTSVKDKIETEKEKNTEEKNENTSAFSAQIQSFSEKYEILSVLLKKLKKEKSEIKEFINDTFNLEKVRNNIIKEIKSDNPEFLNKLKLNYPELTTNEIQHCLLIKVGLSYKEISAIMNISVNGVKIARNRLRKKLNLSEGVKTQDFIENI